MDGRTDEAATIMLPPKNCLGEHEKSSDHNRLIIGTSPVGSEASLKVSLNSRNKLLRNSSDKNCTICTMENFKGP